ncbi:MULTISPECIES: nuclear transport factor 2 family protein [unclassified Rudaea]|uniref:YybH family protein n=1 Tax=unclassified Rudaea TaxID=2627037 RepID=UPI001485B815|nr:MULTISPECIES: nuclear transport factor 2 family protein [unclassified Rudaea]
MKLPGFASIALVASLVLAGCAVAPPKVARAEAQREVEAAERAFAKTMADRDHAAFAGFIADDAIFFGGKEPLRGKAQVAAGWKKYFDKPAAPFSWEPAQVEVLDSGTLALSTGPVRAGDGKIIATFNSIWRREAPGVWRVVFDKGSEVCGDGK